MEGVPPDRIRKNPGVIAQNIGLMGRKPDSLTNGKIGHVLYLGRNDASRSLWLRLDDVLALGEPIPQNFVDLVSKRIDGASIDEETALQIEAAVQGSGPTQK
ncbi:MAG: hypothetical protein WC890_06640 [Candidatus Margulisiibacteriota bacterium]